MLAEQSLRKGLKTKVFGNKIFSFDTIDSTNNCAKAVAGCGAVEGTVVIADNQTDGKGRHGRTWLSSPAENLMFSLVLRPKVAAECLNLLPLYVAVAVADAIEKSTGLKVECKWPNDLLVNGKKLAGILIEGSVKQNTVEYVVIGIGINVNQTAFPPSLGTKATSVKLESSRAFVREDLFRSILHSLEKTYFQASPSGFQSILPEWISHTSMINKPISVSLQGSVISGVVKGVSPEGGLILQTEESEKTLYAGDVSLIGS